MPIIHVKLKGNIEADGRLRLDVPTQLPTGEAEIALTIRSDNGANKRHDFSDLAGRLAWDGDAVSEQRSLRDEW